MTNRKKDAFWNTLGSGIFSLVSFVLLILISRQFGTETAGQFSIAMAIAQLLYIVALFGVNTYQMTDYAEKYDLPQYLSVRILTSVLTAVICLVTIRLSGYTGLKASLTGLLTLFMILNAFAEVFQSLFFQKGRLDLSGKSMFYRTAVSLASFAVFIAVTDNLIVSLTGLLLTNVAVTCVYTVRLALPFSRIAVSMEFKKIRGLFLDCVPIFIAYFLMIFMINCQKYAIEFYLNDAVQGYFGMIFMPAQVISLFSSFVFKPYLKEYALCLNGNENRRFWRLFLKQIAFIMGVTAVCCAGAFLIGTQVLGFIYKKDLASFRLQLVLIVFGGGFLAVCSLLYYLIIILRKQHLIFLSYLISSAAAAGTSMVFVKNFGISGAVASFVISHFVLMCISASILAALVRRKRACLP